MGGVELGGPQEQGPLAAPAGGQASAQQLGQRHGGQVARCELLAEGRVAQGQRLESRRPEEVGPHQQHPAPALHPAHDVRGQEGLGQGRGAPGHELLARTIGVAADERGERPGTLQELVLRDGERLDPDALAIGAEDERGVLRRQEHQDSGTRGKRLEVGFEEVFGVRAVGVQPLRQRPDGLRPNDRSQRGAGTQLGPEQALEQAGPDRDDQPLVAVVHEPEPPGAPPRARPLALHPLEGRFQLGQDRDELAWGETLPEGAPRPVGGQLRLLDGLEGVRLLGEERAQAREPGGFQLAVPVEPADVDQSQLRGDLLLDRQLVERKLQQQAPCLVQGRVGAGADRGQLEVRWADLRQLRAGRHHQVAAESQARLRGKTGNGAEQAVRQQRPDPLNGPVWLEGGDVEARRAVGRTQLEDRRIGRMDRILGGPVALDQRGGELEQLAELGVGQVG